MAAHPAIILLISGKRKSGKDYISEKLLDRCNHDLSTIVRISEPIKSHYAKTFQLDLKQLLSDGEYKEKFRLDMIKWSEEVRSTDPGCFCKIACDNALKCPIWIVSDIRRKTDIKWFKENYGDKVRTVRINADEAVRKNRGYQYIDGIDNKASECDLDDIETWDYTFINNTEEDAKKIIISLGSIVKDFCN